MQEMNRLDRSVERPIYNNEEIARLHQSGIVSRSEAEALDIIQTGFSQVQQDAAGPTEAASESVEEQCEPSCIALIYEGVVIPILNLEEITRRPRTLIENLAVCRQVASLVYDILLALLEEEGDKNE